ncbi:unnamed protein product [Sympodiomycopsis kandeliae]
MNDRPSQVVVFRNLVASGSKTSLNMAGPASSSSLTAAKAVQRQLATLRSRIFQTAPPPPLTSPGGIRTGSKILKARLRGPSMLQYYSPKLKLKSFNNIDVGDGPVISNFDPIQELKDDLDAEYDKDDPQRPPVPQANIGPQGGVFTFQQVGEASKGGLELEDESEIERLRDVQVRKARGKGPPKKSHGKRAALGKKKK